MDQNFYSKFYKAKPNKKQEKNQEQKKPLPPKEKKASNKTSAPQAKAKSPKYSYTLQSQLFQESKIPSESLAVLENFDTIIQNVRPLNSKQMQQLPNNIRDLSHQMTDHRSDRRLGYMNENTQLSAYVRYFTWWNLVRLSRLFSNLPEQAFPQEDSICLDLGTGPLTVVTALWLSRPELRKLNLTWYCLDVSQKTMALGEDVYLSVAAKIPGNTWKIIRVNGSFGESIKQKASFITCANMFNELDQNSEMPPEFQTKKYFTQLLHYAEPKTKFLLIEPGVPKSARTLSLLRDRFIKEDYTVLAPCPHFDQCPMNGFKAYTGSSNKWCNLAFNTETAPKKLQQLSEKAKLPKERAVLSFISVVPASNQKAPFAETNTTTTSTHSSQTTETSIQNISARIISDPFRLPAYRTGFYACTQLGLTLITVPQAQTPDQQSPQTQKTTQNPTQKPTEKIVSGTLLNIQLNKKAPETLPKDEKSGALRIDL